MNIDIRNLQKWLNEEQEAPIDRQALARVLAMAEQPAQQEPVVSKATYNRMRDDYNDLLAASQRDVAHAKNWREHVTRCQLGQVDLDHVFTSPPAQRTWVGLTDEELRQVWYDDAPVEGGTYIDKLRQVEAKLKEKNT